MAFISGCARLRPALQQRLTSLEFGLSREEGFLLTEAEITSVSHWALTDPEKNPPEPSSGQETVPAVESRQEPS